MEAREHVARSNRVKKEFKVPSGGGHDGRREFHRDLAEQLSNVGSHVGSQTVTTSVRPNIRDLV